MNKHHKSLELNKILDMLSEMTSCDDAKEMALNIVPATELYDAQAMLNQTDAAYVLLAKFGSPSFGALKNVNSALSRAAAGGALNMRELLDVGEVLRVIRSLSEWRYSQPGAESVLDAYFASLMPNRSLENSIFSSIANEEEMADTASPTLADIRRKIKNKAQSVREKLESMIRSAYYQKFLQDAIITQRNGRFVVPVKSEHRGEVQGLVHDTSGSGATVFIEPLAVVEANNDIRVLQGKEKEEIERILAELSSLVGDYAETIKHNYESLVELNLIFAKASLAYKMKATVPSLNTQGVTVLNHARHPLLDPKKVVATDISLGVDFDTLVITGPNTGGKTVSIKTLGLLTLMAACGLMIPAFDGSKVCIYKDVFADIGDEQSIEQSLSTFSSHMVNIVDILSKCGERSLVLIDELGAGTDPVEGAALATAILERLFISGAKTAATTHYAELKSYALQTARVENACCEFDVKTLRPTYRLLIGVPGRSNAFAIGERLGLDSDLIDRAKALVSEESTRFEDVMDKLETTRLNLEAEQRKAESERKELAEKLKAADEKLKEADGIFDRELEKARGEALRMSENAKRQAGALMLEAEKLRKEMNASKDPAEAARKAKNAMKKGLQELDRTVNPVSASVYDNDDYTLPRPLKIGDTVFITEIGKEGVVDALPDKKGNVSVSSGIMRMRVEQSKLRLVEKKKDTKKQPVMTRNRGTESSLTASAENRCDLRGMTVDEAIFTLESFIDGMLLHNISEFTVIHGKGTGALRSAVQKYLKGSKFVKSYRLGVYGEGENGVTIVTLK